MHCPFGSFLADIVSKDWTREYPGQEEILAYLMSVAGQYDLYPHIRFNSTVESAEWDEENKKWKVKVTTAKGSKDAEFNPEYELKCDFLVSGVGQLNQPRWPDIPAIKDYEGRLMHSARWDWGYDLIGKKIAVIGNGKLLLRGTHRVDSSFFSHSPRRDRRANHPRNCQSRF